MNPFGYFGYLPSTPVTYVHQCPYCHAIHENKDEFEMWCGEHAGKKVLWDKRGRNMERWDYTWSCPGCPECEEE